MLTDLCLEVASLREELDGLRFEYLVVAYMAVSWALGDVGEARRRLQEATNE